MDSLCLTHLLKLEILQKKNGLAFLKQNTFLQIKEMYRKRTKTNAKETNLTRRGAEFTKTIGTQKKRCKNNL